MKKNVHPVLLSVLLASVLTACVGTTGGELIDFAAYASGPADASGAPGTPHAYTFLSPLTGYTITLNEATLQIGAVYLDAAPCNPGSGVPPCVDQNAATVAQVSGGVTGAYGVQMSGVLVDTLSPDPQPFAAGGSATIQPEEPAQSAEVWLVAPEATTLDAVDDPNDDATIAAVVGTAEKDGKSYPFTATVTIGKNRLLPVSNPALPGQSPICQQRIVRPICLTPAGNPRPGTSLHVGVDPKSWFTNVDFSALDMSHGPPYAIPDDNNAGPAQNFFQGLESSSGVYSFTFQAP